MVRIVDPKIKGIEEDINTEASKNNDNTFERKLYFYTNLYVESIEDAIVIFRLYLKRWSIETWFRYLKQVFGLEKMCLLNLKKLKNLCQLLVYSTYYLYTKFYEIRDYTDNFSKNSLEQIIFDEEIDKKYEEKNFVKLISWFYIRLVSK